MMIGKSYYRRRKVYLLEEKVQSLEQENKALKQEVECLQNINNCLQENSNGIQDEIDVIKTYLENNLVEINDIRQKYKDAIRSAYKIKREYENKMRLLLRKFEKETW